MIDYPTLDPTLFNASKSKRLVVPTRFGSSRFYSDWVKDKSKVGAGLYHGETSSFKRCIEWGKHFGYSECITQNGKLFVCRFNADRTEERVGFWPDGEWEVNTRYYNDEKDWPLGSKMMGEPHPNIVAVPRIAGVSYWDLTA